MGNGPSNRHIFRFSAIVVAFLLTAGCSAESDSRSTTNPSSQQEVGLSNSDVMFLQMMIPHHQQAVEISNLAMRKSTDPELLALAERIASDQDGEITMMRNWLQDAGEDEVMGHTMHGMDGMLSDEELDLLEGAAGLAFDRAWLKGMIKHHEGALEMVEMITDARAERLRDFGQRIIEIQSQEITEMNAILAKLG